MTSPRHPQKDAPSAVDRPTSAAPEPDVLDAAADIDRLRAIARYDLSGQDLRDRLDAIAAQTRAELDLPISLVSMVLDTAQLIVGSSGLSGWANAVGGAPVEWSFCAHAVATGRPYVVEDAARDAVQRDNPLVTNDGIGSYAGVPLVSPDGHVLGAHCAVGTEAHAFTRHDLAVLEKGATEVMRVLEEFSITPHR